MIKQFKSQSIKDYVLDGESVENPEGIEFIEEGEWEDDGKYSYCEYIFKHEGKHYSIWNSRTGSYYSEYYYGSEDWGEFVDCQEVKKVSKNN